MRSENPTYPNFLNGSLPEFSTFTTTLDNLMKDLRASGVGATSKHTEGISREEEELLWSTGILNNCTPMGLLRAVFFYNGKVFCLRGGQEHRCYVEAKNTVVSNFLNWSGYITLKDTCIERILQKIEKEGFPRCD